MHMEDLGQDERPGMSQCLHGLYVDGSHEMTTVTARLARSIVLQLKRASQTYLLRLFIYKFQPTGILSIFLSLLVKTRPKFDNSIRADAIHACTQHQ